MIACLLIPGFELQAALRNRPRLALRAAALAPLPGTEPLLGPVTAAAEAVGVRPGMRLGEALATCPSLVLVERDPAEVENQWEAILGRLEDNGFAVEPVEPGCLYFDTRGVERLYGGVAASLKRALAAAGSPWNACAGGADRRFAALAAAAIARPGQAVVVDDQRTKEFLAPLPLTLLPLEAGRCEELQNLGIKKIGQLAGLPGSAVAERLGPDGRRAWSLARAENGGNTGFNDASAGFNDASAGFNDASAGFNDASAGFNDAKVTPRPPATDLVERLEFPEAVANELTLRRALTALLDRILARPERGGREIRKVALSARLVGGGSWRRTMTLREPSGERGTLRAALGPKLAELPAPALSLGLELLMLSESEGRQLALVRPEGEELETRLRDGLRQVRARAGAGAVATVVEVAPWSRIPEQRALLVPRD
jgi:impB/mucB/samB family/impB/mucB/samB family C-terminal domain